MKKVLAAVYGDIGPVEASYYWHRARLQGIPLEQAISDAWSDAEYLQGKDKRQALKDVRKYARKWRYLEW